jgi:hypothetical protein
MGNASRNLDRKPFKELTKISHWFLRANAFFSSIMQLFKNVRFSRRNSKGPRSPNNGRLGPRIHTPTCPDHTLSVTFSAGFSLSAASKSNNYTHNTNKLDLHFQGFEST